MWFCEKWEGELAITTVPGTPRKSSGSPFEDDAIARKIMEAAGQRFALVHEQHEGVPSACFGETEYFITSARPMGQ
jgi:hypothetical protein